MIGHREWSPCAIRILPNHRNVLSLPDKAKPQKFKRLADSPWERQPETWALDGYSRFGYKGFKHRRLDLKNLPAKSINMETNSRLNVG